MSYCTGAAGRANFEATLADASAAFDKNTDRKGESRKNDHISDQAENKKHKKKKKKKDKKDVHNEDNFEAEVAKAMEKQRKEEEISAIKDERKRTYNCVSGGLDKELTEAVS